ncbi:putative bicarbonate transporter, IctB family [Waterburya agarophytonicola K14]|uniref:Bicarbonate transporter, IctB family n=1 Tax=Waterburya agarophytonicola KI4 TaxID=2874699 RepID=A0A964BR43_9CYAN|nr:putative bicarbonate transporter, IctB family [Waterburya agarophytonicola KI4]
MKTAWSTIMLSKPQILQWQKGSYLYRLVGWLSNWRQGSWLLQWSEAIAACLISLVFLLAPFVSTSLIGVLLIAVAAFWILNNVSTAEKAVITPVHILIFLYWCVATVATAFSPVKSAALNGWVTLTLYLILFALAAQILRSPRLCNWIITSFLLTALVVSAYGVRQEFFGVQQLATWNDPNSPLANDTRVYSYLGNPNLLGGYLLPAIALSFAAIFIWRGWIQKTLAAVMVMMNSACLYFTDSRGAWLAMAVLIGVLLLLCYFWWQKYLPRFWQIWLLPLVFGSLGGLFIVAFISVEPLRIRLLSIFAGREDSSNNFRINVWEACFKIIEDYPLIGIGPGNDAFNQIYPRYMNSRYPALSAYSVYLEHIVEMGYIGFGCFLWLIAVTINHGVRQLTRLRQSRNKRGFYLIAAIAATASLGFHGFVDTVWYRPQINTIWWLMLAIVASFYDNIKLDRNSNYY